MLEEAFEEVEAWEQHEGRVRDAVEDSIYGEEA